MPSERKRRTKKKQTSEELTEIGQKRQAATKGITIQNSASEAKENFGNRGQKRTPLLSNFQARGKQSGGKIAKLTLVKKRR